MSLLTVDEIIKGVLIFLRIGGIIFFLPIFGDVPTPVRLRLFIAATLGCAFYQLVPVQWNSSFAFDAISLAVLVLKELLIGFTIGFIARMAFEGIIMAANLVGFQMGFGMATMFVPDASEQMNSFTALHRILVISIFFALNLHYIFINAIAESFALIPLGYATLTGSLGELLLTLSAGLFTIAIQLAAPVLVALLFTMGALGLAARTVPQLNVFVMSFPISFFVGLLIYIASFPFLPEWLTWHFGKNNDDIMTALVTLRPRG